MRRGPKWTQLLRGTSRWGAVALAAFYLNFVSVHLATELHFHSGVGEHAHAHPHPDASHDDEHEHGNGDQSRTGHTPHDASDHLLDVALKGGHVMQAPVLLVAADTFIIVAPLFFTSPRHVFERERPPGEFFPDPHQPRAPPLA